MMVILAKDQQTGTEFIYATGELSSEDIREMGEVLGAEGTSYRVVKDVTAVHEWDGYSIIERSGFFVTNRPSGQFDSEHGTLGDAREGIMRYESKWIGGESV